MMQKMSAPVSVVSLFDHKKRVAYPKKVLFEGKEHLIIKTGFHHTFRDGRTLYHVFSVASETLYFRLVLNTDNLFWTVEEISDGESN
jgi:hypothetical protein